MGDQSCGLTSSTFVGCFLQGHTTVPFGRRVGGAVPAPQSTPEEKLRISQLRISRRVRKRALPKWTRKRVLGATAVITVLGVVPTVAVASQEGGGGGSLSARMENAAASPWYANGKFALSNRSGAPADKWKLEFDVVGGSFDNHSSWNTDLVRTGSHVTLTPKAGQAIPAGGTRNLLWGIQGTGTARPALVNCSLDGKTVEGCPSDRGVQPSGQDAGHDDHQHGDHEHATPPEQPAEPSPPAPPPVADGAKGGDSPGTGPGPTAFTATATSRTEGGATLNSLRLSWAAPGRSDRMRRYEVYVNGRFASTVYQKATGGSVQQTLPLGPTPAGDMKVKVRSQLDGGGWSTFSPELTVRLR